ncbi:bifunctional diaminohydroxyphosphoribosylaminopyrimidine deaminase/5-amino-6-(5-phosphoribosylamino)uracil reductase RibD [Aureibacillus halotolerans]|uniref:Riboflavin biosynthesis protein RibD n=1 Tax=Aureibacillus halotolerans TaxID=1508390 RepID=A0A4R6U5T9_9BACI|nr:bifunctional diaminohydroxyphosphoribosylaminopyrimidine deaminase/5-amino-6-(5-phosphoribosylamino)uracil reductase RibD [Aureibacillus halotolerans]TDQ41591.1 diaminohydroxyphosphoribosylaminopyrimidine deaminase [Aureibacillus halotolerans]
MNDEHFMTIALQMAAMATGQTSPNPLVGCVVVKDNSIVGTGAHLRAGRAHAEVNALQMAGEDANGATIYVTLEPCSHTGRTPPCCEAIIKAGVARVVIASMDSNPLVAGKGVTWLKRAGVSVETGVLEKEATQLNRMFMHHISAKKPYTTLKFAASLDGKIATAMGESQWITGERARRDGWKERSLHDGILVGIQTVLADQPALTTRGVGTKTPTRIVLDSHLKLPINATIVTDQMAPTWVLTNRDVSDEKVNTLEALGIRVIKTDPHQLDVWLPLLYEYGITSLYVEGGARVLGSFLTSGNYQRVVAYLAPMLLGGDNALSSFGGKGIDSLANTTRLHFKQTEQIGEDLKIVLESF